MRKKSMKNNSDKVKIDFIVSRDDYDQYILPLLTQKQKRITYIFRDNLKYIYYLEMYPILKLVLDELINSKLHSINDIIIRAIKTAIEQAKLPVNASNLTININIQNLIEKIETLIERVDYLLHAKHVENVVVFQIPRHIASESLSTIDLAKSILKSMLIEKSKTSVVSFKSIIINKLRIIDKLLTKCNKIIRELETTFKRDINSILEATKSKEIQSLVNIRDTLLKLKDYALSETSNITESDIKKMINDALLN